jgi:hypothetical protein
MWVGCGIKKEEGQYIWLYTMMIRNGLDSSGMDDDSFLLFRAQLTKLKGFLLENRLL